MKKLWLGRYISVPSFYHSLDSRAKLLMMVLNICLLYTSDAADEL